MLVERARRAAASSKSHNGNEPCCSYARSTSDDEDKFASGDECLLPGAAPKSKRQRLALLRSDSHDYRQYHYMDFYMRTPFTREVWSGVRARAELLEEERDRTMSKCEEK